MENIREGVAKLNNLSISPRKVRLVADVIRNKKIDYVLSILKKIPNKSSLYVYKLVVSAVDNLIKLNNNFKDAISLENLVIREIKVDCGQVAKRIMAAPQGRVHRIRKRSSIITVVVSFFKIN